MSARRSFRLNRHTSCRASECPYRGVTVTEGLRVSQLLLLRLNLEDETREGEERVQEEKHNQHIWKRKLEPATAFRGQRNKQLTLDKSGV